MDSATTQPTLRLGDRLTAPVFGSLRPGSPPVLLLAAGHRIETLQQLQMLRDVGFAVLLPTEEAAARPAAASATGHTPQTRDFEGRLDCAMQIRRAVKDAANHLYSSVLEGETPDFSRLVDASAQVASEVTIDPHAFATLTFLRMCDDYTVEHSADVAILMVAIARVMGIGEQDLHDVALAGLMHDVGKQLVPQDIIMKRGSLDANELAEVRRHPEHGVTVLVDALGCPDAVREVALQHHERLDGSGYPAGSKAKMHRYSLIAATADTFDAMTAKRVYSPPKPARQAIKELYAKRGHQYDPDAVDALVKLIGAYPVGTRIRLSTGERGIVVAPNYEDSTRPIVEIDTHPDGRPLSINYRKALAGSSCSILAAEL